MERSKLPAAGSDDFIFRFMNNFPQSWAQGENLMHGVSFFFSFNFFSVLLAIYKKPPQIFWRRVQCWSQQFGVIINVQATWPRFSAVACRQSPRWCC